jgi:hypothetical protein
VVSEEGEPTLGWLGISRRPFHPTRDRSLAEIKTEPKKLAVDARRMDIGRLSPAFPVTPPYVRVRIRRFGGLSYRATVNLGSPSESK